MFYFSPWKIVSILILVALALAIAASNLLSPQLRDAWFGWLPRNELTLGLDLQGGVHILLQADPQDLQSAGEAGDGLSNAIGESVAVIRRRLAEIGVGDPLVQRRGDRRILVQVPGLDDPQYLKQLIGQKAELTFHLISDAMDAHEALVGAPPPGTELVYEEDVDPPTPYLIETEPFLRSAELADAKAGTDQGEPMVEFALSEQAASRMCETSRENIGRAFALVLDTRVISAPVIEEAACDGGLRIFGNFTPEGAENLAVLLRGGALPVNLDVVEERTIGPGLGADSISAAKLAAFAGALGVMIFMLLAYGLLGLIADIALIANMALLISLLSLAGATLTLPGVAGIVLTMVLAVDANVLIFERIAEERRGGRNLLQSFHAGFRQAFSTILNANIATLIAAGVLYSLGAGPVRGFAVTLAIGVFTTILTAGIFTRMLVALWVRIMKPLELPRGLLRLVPEDSAFEFTRHWRFCVPFSLAAVVASLLLLGTVGLNFGIDFRGGTLIEAQSHGGEVDLAEIRSDLAELNIGDVRVRQFGSPADVLIQVESQGIGDSAEQSIEAKLRNALEESYDFRRVEVVGPTVSDELGAAGTLSLLVAIAAIMLFIWLRFEWRFALGAILTMLHVLVLTAGMLALLQLEFSLATIAALLMIAGYALNDSLVIYDRVRRILRKTADMPVAQVLELAGNQTLSRTVMTAAMALVALLGLHFFGGPAVRPFTLPMIFGIVVATWSSIYIAAPLLVLLRLRPGQLTGSRRYRHLLGGRSVAGL